MHILQVNPEQPEPEAIQIAARIIRDGGLVAFPTETVYGLGANGLDSAAIAGIYRAKQRPAGDPIIAHIDHTDQLATLAVHIPPVAYELAAAFWPGPLTFVLHRAPDVPDNIAAGRPTIAVRMPSHPVARALLAAADVPIAAPSANTFTRPSATSAAHVIQDLDGRIDAILDGGMTTIGLESTVLDLTATVPVVLRPGGVVVEALRHFIPDMTVQTRYLKADEAAVSPGQMLKHYAPDAHLTVFTGAGRRQALYDATRQHRAAGQRVGLLVTDDVLDMLQSDAFKADLETGVVVYALGAPDDLDSISRKLFDGLRALDARQVDVILALDFGREGLGAALWDRLLRAAEGNIITSD